MKKIETTHLKASRVGGVDRWRQRQNREVRVWESKFEKVESIREGRDGSEVWISGKPKAWVWGMDRRLGAWVNLGVWRNGSAGGLVTSSFDGLVTLRIESGRGQWDREVRVWESEFEGVERVESVLSESLPVGE